MHLPIESHLQSDHTSSLLSIDFQLSTTKSEGVKVFIECVCILITDVMGSMIVFHTGYIQCSIPTVDF